MKKKIAIIGAGWFGCHIANEIIKFGGFDLKIEDELLGIDSSNKFNEIDLLFKEIKMSIRN